MGNDIRITINPAIGLPEDVRPTSAVTVPEFQVDADVNPYWNAFAKGFKIGFFKPYEVLLSIASCQSGSPLIDNPMGDAMSLDASGEANGGDGGPDATSRRGTDTPDAGETPEYVAVDTADAGADSCQEFCDAGVTDAADIAGETTETQADAGETNGATDTVSDATLDGVTDTADIAEEASGAQDVAGEAETDAETTPDVEETGGATDVSVQDSAPEAAGDSAVTICQYQWQCPDASGVELSAEVTMSQEVTPTTSTVFSQICTGPGGNALSLMAPVNSKVVACTNATINALILGGKSCVAECGFYDNNVILSTDPNNPVAFSTALFVPPQAPMQAYTVTLTLHPPLFSNGTQPALPGFLGSSFVFVFDQKHYNTVGDIVWDAQDKNADGTVKGTVQITYQPKDFFFNLSEFLDITYVNLSGQKVSYRYPCDTLVDSNNVPNPIINCTEVK